MSSIVYVGDRRDRLLRVQLLEQICDGSRRFGRVAAFYVTVVEIEIQQAFMEPARRVQRIDPSEKKLELLTKMIRASG